MVFSRTHHAIRVGSDRYLITGQTAGGRYLAVVEVEEVVFGAPFVTRGRERTYRVLGQTEAGRFLTIIMARRQGSVFAVLTARDATRAERRALRRQ